MQIISQPLPGLDLRNRQARLPIRQRQEVPPTPNHSCQDDPRRGPGSQHALPLQPLTCALEGSSSLLGNLPLQVILLCQDGLVLDDGFCVEYELYQCAGDERGGEMGGQVVVQEELAAHEVEW